MTVIVRGQASDCGNPLLHLAIRVDGSPVDVSEIAFEIYDKTGASPVHIFPAGGGREVVSIEPCPLGDRVDAGRYVARWMTPLAEPLGLHEIRWFVRQSPGASVLSFSEDFYVSALNVIASASYTTIAALRDEGITVEQASDAALARKIRLASALIDRWCGWWFYPKALTFHLDGSGGRILQLGAPIIAITSVSVHDEPLDFEYLRIYNRHLTECLNDPDDRQNPKLEWELAENEHSAGWFRKGTQNVRVVGRFGFTDYDGTPDGKTPDMIALACALLVVRGLAKLSDTDVRDEARNRSRVVGLRTRDQEISWAGPGAGAGVGTRGTGAWSGDPEIDNIIASYRRPPVLGAV